ncbi:unnamed protein product [Strongylus vulgaris]|uniref:Uncharacterized protein n=1 Tax=Strongylus vulgaris TaxID=40348 RepID=A0A3P7JF18_STRVU|nr:unnamed protein product [Strongylus vulgaris]
MGLGIILVALSKSSFKDSVELGILAAQLKDVVAERLASITDVNHEEFDGTYIQATALNPQLAVLLSEQQLSYARSAIEQELHTRQPPVSSSLGVDALLASVLTSSPDSLPLYSDLLQQAQRLQQDRNSQPMRDRITEAALSSYFDELLSGVSVFKLFRQKKQVTLEVEIKNSLI